MTTLDLRKEAAPAPAFVSAAARFGVIEKPDLAFTPAVARETEHLYEKVKDFIPAFEWAAYAPYVHAINRLKKERNAVILAHNYQTRTSFTAWRTSSAIRSSLRATPPRSTRRSSSSAACTLWPRPQSCSIRKKRCSFRMRKQVARFRSRSPERMCGSSGNAIRACRSSPMSTPRPT